MKVNFSHTANQKYLENMMPQQKSSMDFANREQCDPKSIENVYSKLGMHEEVVKTFWDIITKKLPEDCRWIVYGRAVLVNASNGVIFGFKAGNVFYALRLPEHIKEKAFGKGGKPYCQFLDGKKIQASDLGDNWIFFPKYTVEQVDWCLDAFKYAGTLNGKN